MPNLARVGIWRFTCALLAALFVAIALAGPASAATTGTISGTVLDPANKPIAGAHVTASAPSGRGAATTDASGFYNIYNLAPDTYSVSISAKGYEDVLVSGVTSCRTRASRSIRRCRGRSRRSAASPRGTQATSCSPGKPRTCTTSPRSS